MQRTTRWIALLMLVSCGGCSKSQMPASQVMSAESDYSEALEAFQAKDFATALERFNSAIEGVGLNPDLLGVALLRSADCHVELGNLEEAAAVLESLEENAPEMDQFHLVRCKLYSKQGDSTKARAEFDAARAINPRLEPPVTLTMN